MVSVVRLPTQPTQLFKRVIQTWGTAQFLVTTPVAPHTDILRTGNHRPVLMRLFVEFLKQKMNRAKYTVGFVNITSLHLILLAVINTSQKCLKS